MSRILVVRPSSLGDVVYAMALVDDVLAHDPRRARSAWVAEEAFASLVRLDPRVGPVVPVAFRRWRKRPLAAATWREFRAFRAALRARALRRHPRPAGTGEGRPHRPHGARPPARPRPAQHPRTDRDAVRRRAPPHRARPALRRQVPCAGRGRARLRRHRPAALALRRCPTPCRRCRPAPMRSCSMRRVAPTSSGRRRTGARCSRASPARASPRCCRGAAPTRRRAATGSRRAPSNAVVPPRQSLPALAALARSAQVVVGVDTGLTHLAAALGAPTVAIFAATDPRLAGVARVGAHAQDVGDARGAPSFDAVAAAAGRALRHGAAMLMRALYAVAVVDRAAVPAAQAVVARPPRAGLPDAHRRALRPLSRRRAGAGPRRVLWIHAVSLGETRAAAPLIERLLRERPRRADPAHAHDRDRTRSGPHAVRRPRACRRGCPTTCRSRCARSWRASRRRRDC